MPNRIEMYQKTERFDLPAAPVVQGRGIRAVPRILRSPSPVKKELRFRARTEKPRSLAKTFGDYFEVVPATTDELRSEVYRLRYQIYCIETGFEDSSRFPEQLESDEYDGYSIHALLRHRRTGIYAGTVRLVKTRPEIEKSLPIQRISSHPLFFDQDRFPRETLAEVSRFAISKGFRRRLNEFASTNAAGGPYDLETRAGEEERRVLPHITLGLFIALVRLSKEHGIKNWYCVIERALVRLLDRYALHVTPCGPIVDYHGKRQPCYVDIDEFLERARKEQPAIWELITDNGQSWG